MNKRIQTILSLLVLILCFNVDSFSQNIELKIEVPDTVEVGQRFRLRYSIKADSIIQEFPDVKLPEGLTFLYGPSISTSVSTVSKKTTTYITHFYGVMAESAGEIIIPKFEFTLGGNKFEADDRKIIVMENKSEKEQNDKSSKAETQKQRAEERDKSDKKGDYMVDAFVKTIPSKSRVGTSDTLSVVYRLYTTSKELKILDVNLPYSRAFYGETLSSNHGEKKEKIDGKEYYVFDLYKVILQPAREGRQTFEDGQILLRYYFATGKKKQTFFGEVDEYVEKDMELKIEGFDVRVQDLVAV